MPAIVRRDSLRRLLQVAIFGAAVTVLVGFNWGGWVTGGVANDMAQRSASSALVLALSPICVDKFQRSADAAANLMQLRKTISYQRASFIENGGWALMPGSAKVNSAVAPACTEILSGAS